MRKLSLIQPKLYVDLQNEKRNQNFHFKKNLLAIKKKRKFSEFHSLWINIYFRLIIMGYGTIQHISI